MGPTPQDLHLGSPGVLPFWTYSVYALATPLSVVHRQHVPGHGPHPGIQDFRTSKSGIPKPWILRSGPPNWTPRGYLPTGPQSGYLGWLPAHIPFWTCTVYAPLVPPSGIHRRDASGHPRYYGLGPIWTSQNGSFSGSGDLISGSQTTCFWELGDAFSGSRFPRPQHPSRGTGIGPLRACNAARSAVLGNHRSQPSSEARNH